MSFERIFLKNFKNYLHRKKIENWIEIVFKEIPTINIMFGCSQMTLSTEALFPQYYIDKYFR